MLPGEHGRGVAGVGAGVALEEYADLVTRSHTHRPAYKPARELYPWVDLQPSGMLRSLYTGHEWEPEALIRADLAIAQARAQEDRKSTRLNSSHANISY